MTKDELVDKLVELYTSTEIPVTAAGGVFAFTYGDQVVDVYSPTELMNAAAAKDTRIKPRYQAELGSAFNMYRYFKSHPVTLSAKQAVQKIEGSRQRIVYGAPGTGKSFGTDGELLDANGNEKAICFRTTFHPDSDYSTFIGAYKPTVDESKKIVYDFRPQAFMNAYVAAWKEASKGAGGEEWTDKVKKPYSGLNEVMVNVVNAFIAEGGKGVVKSYKEIMEKAIEFSGGKYKDRSLVPSFYCYNRVNEVQPQTRPALFEHLENGTYRCLGPDDATYDGDILWKEKGSGAEKIVGKCTAGERKLFAQEPGKPVVLVVEEINRGNCAQIFGDIFQLLDRDESGYSTYPISADVDLAKWLSKEDQFGEGLEGIDRPGCIRVEDWNDILAGRKLALPPNLYIWATMNTSDQSLFPIDSAFKRRWDWEYVPILEGKDKDTKTPLGWKIVVGADAAKKEYDWWSFVGKINDVIDELTSSEDKKLGYFFVKPKDKTIDQKLLVNKVFFYLWNDVFKDMVGDPALQVQINGKGHDLKFHDFFKKDDGAINVDMIKAFMDKLKVEPPDSNQQGGTTPQTTETTVTE